MCTFLDLDRITVSFDNLNNTNFVIQERKFIYVTVFSYIKGYFTFVILLFLLLDHKCDQYYDTIQLLKNATHPCSKLTKARIWSIIDVFCISIRCLSVHKAAKCHLKQSHKTDLIVHVTLLYNNYLCL